MKKQFDSLREWRESHPIKERRAAERALAKHIERKLGEPVNPETVRIYCTSRHPRNRFPRYVRRIVARYTGVPLENL